VRLDDAHRPGPGGKDRPSRVGRGPSELFGDYLREQDIDDPRLQAMFATLLDEVTEATAGER
jgi:DNA repair protein SbcD/Mre11